MNFDLLLAAVVFVFGLAFGSFLNVCIHRLPRGLSVVFPASACPQCKSAIKPYDNIPVISWLLLRGRCRSCSARISPRYLAVELLTAALFVVCFAAFGPTLEMLKFCVFSFLLLGLIFTDAEHQLLPDRLTLTGLALGIAFSLLVPVDNVVTSLLNLFVPLPDNWRMLSLADSIAGAALGSSFIYGAGFLYQRARGVEGMGFGDVKLMAMVGAFLGVKLTVFTLFAASLAGSVVGVGSILWVWRKRLQRRLARAHEPVAAARRRAWRSALLMYRAFPIPFGVYLGGMAMLAAFVGDRIIGWYLGLDR